MKEEHRKNEKGKNLSNVNVSRANNQGLFWNIYSFTCITLSVILIIFSCFIINDYKENIKKINVNYRWPKLSDLVPSIFILPLIMISKTAIEYFSIGFVDKVLAKKIKESKEKFNIYRHKLTRHVYKIIFYSGITAFGYYVLHNLPYFPKSMFGNGWMPNMFIKGYPDCLFHEKPPLFDLYYNISLAYFVNDFIFLFIMERQNDFYIMILHHICTISLIIFSFITNYSNIGSLVIFCHMQSDIIVHVTRFLVNTDCSLIIVGFVGMLFLLNYSYMRQYVFGDMIYTIWKYANFKWGVIERSLVLFLVFLYIMHIRWTSILIIKTYQLFTKRTNVGDDVNFDKLNKEKTN